MQRRHLHLIADVIQGMEDDRQRKNCAMRFAHRLKLMNPLFDEVKFYKSCNVRVPQEVWDRLSVAGKGAA